MNGLVYYMQLERSNVTLLLENLDSDAVDYDVSLLPADSPSLMLNGTEV